MGCDIHTYIEYKEDGNWYCNQGQLISDCNGNVDALAEVCGERWYERFSLLAGVRGWLEPIKDPKDIPEDCSEFVKNEYEDWKLDAHSESWYTLKELMDYKGNNKRLIVDMITELKKEIQRVYRTRDIKKHAEDVRFVFWFDN